MLSPSPHILAYPMLITCILNAHVVHLVLTLPIRVQYVCRTKRLCNGNPGAPGGLSNDSRVERVIVKYHVGTVHEYNNSVKVALNYPDVPETPDNKTWPLIPPYNCTPQTYITEHFRRDIASLDNLAVRGETCQHLIQTVKEWDVQPQVL